VSIAGRYSGLIAGVLRLICAAGLVVVGYDWRAPHLAGVRGWLLAALIVLPVGLIAFELWIRRRQPMQSGGRVASMATLALAIVALVTTLAQEARFRWIRHNVLAAEPAALETLGRHFIVGYRHSGELRPLIERRAVAGVFITARNIEGKTAEDVRREIDTWQAIRRRQGLPPLWIAADQEGGLVSRLSPPLTRLPPLAEIAAQNPDATSRRAAVRHYAQRQGNELSGMGVNLNLAPVVDLNHGVSNPNDRFTRISKRAISSNPLIVSEVAGEYCAGMLASGVRCTLKHFPGLGRVFEDTHRDNADLDADTSELERSDWVPFRALMPDHRWLVMLGHARLTGIDRQTPASFSRAVVTGLLRETWRYDGVLLTDDFSMGAVYASPEGVAGASLVALNAGVDLILLSFDPDQFYLAMDRLLRAMAGGQLSPQILEASRGRLARLQRG
jgi:beta-N-acetylhexosaminidase